MWRNMLKEQTKNLNSAFDELLNFTGCDDVLGPVVCRKLHNDFEMYTNYIIIPQDDDFWITYNQFAIAFKDVTKDGKNGIVIFR